MNLRRWKPVIDDGQYPGKYLSIQTTLECPFCSKPVTIITGGHSISTSNKDNLIQWKTDEVLKPRACSNCGIISTLPEADKRRLLEEVGSIITVEWLEKHKD